MGSRRERQGFDTDEDVVSDAKPCAIEGFVGKEQRDDFLAGKIRGVN